MDWVVRGFKALGARCRKKGDSYYCYKDSVEAIISSDVIDISVPVEFRTEYSDFAPRGMYEDEFLKAIEEKTGAYNAIIEVKAPDAKLTLRFEPKDATKAMRTFSNLVKHEMDLAITNIAGEVRCYKGGEWIENIWEWIENLG